MEQQKIKKHLSYNLIYEEYDNLLEIGNDDLKPLTNDVVEYIYDCASMINDYKDIYDLKGYIVELIFKYCV